MKRTIFPFLMLLLVMVSCRQSTEQHSVNDSCKLQNGDLIFVGIPMDYTISDTSSIDQAIIDATGDSGAVNYIHVAIVEAVADSTFIIDATIKRGVARYPIDSFFVDFTLKDGSYPRFDVMRLKNNAEVASYIANAKTYIGRAYDQCFLPDNAEQYCSELVRNAFVDKDGAFIFAEAPMNFKNADGVFPPYWKELFKLLGMPIPQDVMGTNPADMSRDTNLYYVTTLVP